MLIRFLFTILPILAISTLGYAIEPDSLAARKWSKEILVVKKQNDSLTYSYLDAEQVFIQRWDTLAHPNFWKRVMLLPPDSCLINIAKSREIVAVMSVADWNGMSDPRKDVYRDSVRLARSLSAEDRIFMTTGKNDFYQFDAVLPSVAKGVEVFNEIGVDPWYAQAILMIESPGKIAKSNAGAYGPFQLMPGVARNHGLRVDKTVDERKDFVKSAHGAASLIKRTCIPEAKRILNQHGIAYNEQDLWFRLFVLHIYHAGAANVAAVMDVIKPEQGGSELIQKMWSNSAAQFKNASQNYSQLALAALLILDEIIWDRCEDLVMDGK
jgi:hypothetical protein